MVPNCLTGDFPSPLPKADGAAGWADAVSVVPVALFRANGSRDLLRRHVGTMQRWVDYVAGLLAEDGTLERRTCSSVTGWTPTPRRSGPSRR